MITQIDHPLPERMPSRMFPQNQFGLGHTHIFRAHDFVGTALLQHAVLMNPSLMGKGILADNRFVSLNRNTSHMADQPAGRIEPTRLNSGLQAEIIVPGSQCHHNFFQRPVTRTLPNSVNRAFNLPSTLLHSGQTVGHSQAQIVMTVNR